MLTTTSYQWNAQKVSARVHAGSCGRLVRTRCIMAWMKWKCSSSPTNLTPSLSYFTQLVIFEDRQARLGFSSLQLFLKLRIRSRCLLSKHVSKPKKTVKLKEAVSFGRSLRPQRNTCFPLASCSPCPGSRGSHREENAVSNKLQITSRHTKPLPNLGLGKVFQHFFSFPVGETYKALQWGRQRKEGKSKDARLLTHGWWVLFKTPQVWQMWRVPNWFITVTGKQEGSIEPPLA